MRHISLCAVALLSILLTSAEGRAAVVTAMSCSSADVQSAINGVQNGDTVVVPAGSCTWTTPVTMNRLVKLTAGGAVAITNNVPFGGTMLTITESTAGHTELTGFTFGTGTGTGKRLLVQAVTNGRAVLVHGNTWSGSSDSILHMSRRGVYWNNTFTVGGQNLSFAQQFNCQLANDTASWSTASTMGTDDTTGENNTYFDGNTATGFFQQFSDLHNGCRIVIRHNIFTNTALASHGWESAGAGVRHYEIYDNRFIIDQSGGYCSGNPPALNFQHLIMLRGGTGTITDNVIPDIKNVCNAYGNVPEIALRVLNLKRYWGGAPNASPPINHRCWGATSPPAEAPNQLWPVPRQIGQSHNGRTYVTDPLYIWNNVGLPNDNPFIVNEPSTECGTSARGISEYLQPQRDYVIGTAKPGYAKYTYPHPLTLSSPVPPPPTTLPAPSGLTVR